MDLRLEVFDLKSVLGTRLWDYNLFEDGKEKVLISSCLHNSSTPTVVLFGVVKDVVNVKALLATVLVVVLLAGSFDYWGARHGKRDKFYMWEYDERSILGIKLFGLPIEDCIFFLVMMPILGIFVYEAAKILLR